MLAVCLLCQTYRSKAEHKCPLQMQIPVRG